jgi:hypothetical protein
MITISLLCFFSFILRCEFKNNSSNYFYIEQNTNSRLGFSNQVYNFNDLVHKIASSRIPPENFYIFGPFSGHIGIYKCDCKLTDFFKLQHICKKTNIFDQNSNLDNLCNNILSLLKKINFISKNFNPNPNAKFKFFKQEITNIAQYRSVSYSEDKIFFTRNSINSNTNLIFNPYFWKIKSKNNFFDFFDFAFDLKIISQILRKLYFAKKKFHSIHLRLKDFKLFCQGKKDCFFELTQYIKVISNYQKQTNIPIFLLSNEKLPKSKFYRLLTISDLERIIILDPFLFKTCLLENMEYVKIFSEIILACFSEIFYYNPYSSFSNLVINYCRVRGFKTRFISIKNLFNKY